MAVQANPIAKIHAAFPLASGVLALLADIGDRSGLNYDPTVESVNLQDALVAWRASSSARSVCSRAPKCWNWPGTATS
jgi:hypothetical protein